MMNLYEHFILPRLIHLACGLKPASLQRKKVVPMASGEVLELGFGSGLNLAYLDRASVDRLWALEPSDEMWSLAQSAVSSAGLSVERLKASAEDIPLPAHSVDTVLVTYALCTIADVARALQETRRVLRPSGRLLFCEHGEAPDENVRRWQTRLNPLWRRLGGGCELNRPIPALIERGGFRVESLSAMYIPGWKPACFNFWGAAAPL
jgi:SAM-dependent methyltransferase